MNGNGVVSAYDLVRGRLRWQRWYDSGIDSPDVSRDGRWLFLPTGELALGDACRVVSAAAERPQQIADIRLQHPFEGWEHPCSSTAHTRAGSSTTAADGSSTWAIPAT